jgi:ATP-dependent Clp protease ATP-binding subunit ClpA
MREYEDPAAVERLFGGAAHEEGRLARALRDEPRAVVQLDEIEAAHPLVLSALQRLLTEGRLELGGTTTDGREAIFVLSSNVGGVLDAEAALAAAREALGPELLDRLDEVVAFEPLGPAEAAAILRPRLAQLVASGPSRHGVTLRIDAEAERFLLEAGTSPEQGARELFPTLERLAEAPLTSLAASGKLARASAWRLAYDEGGVYWVPDE